MYCLKCSEDVSKLMTWDSIIDEEYIKCPKCGNKMKVVMDICYDEESNEEDIWFDLEQYEE